MLRQRKLLYDTEDELMKPWRYFSSVEGAQMWVDKRLRKKWWRKHSDVRHIKIVYPFGGVMSEAHLDGIIGTLKIIPEGLYLEAMVHELAHFLTWIPGKNDERDHGKRFAGALIECYRHLDIASNGEELQKAFDKAGVQWEEYT